MNDIELSFPGGMRVDARIGQWTIRTDQAKESGGDESAPEPYQTFLASLATCSGIYVLRYLQVRDLPTEGLRMTQRHSFNEKTHRLEEVEVDIHLPAGIPEKHRRPIERAVKLCAVKRAMEDPPRFRVQLHG